MPLVVSVMGFSRDELAELVAASAERDEVALIELNFSCPNVETGLIMGADPSETARSVERLRPLTDKPLIVKLTPNATDPAAVAEAAEAAGADAVSLINTLKGMALDPRTGAPWLGGRQRRRLRSGGARDRARAGQRRVPARQHPGDRHGRHRRAAATPAISSTRALDASPWAPRASGTRPPAAGSPTSWASFPATSGGFAPTTARSEECASMAQKALQSARKRVK